MIESIILYVIFINSLGFYLMYEDKKRAKLQQFRIPEKTLWRVAVIGGAAGSHIGMRRFNHKTQKFSFKYGFPILAVFEIGLILFCISISGK